MVEHFGTEIFLFVWEKLVSRFNFIIFRKERLFPCPNRCIINILFFTKVERLLMHFILRFKFLVVEMIFVFKSQFRILFEGVFINFRFDIDDVVFGILLIVDLSLVEGK